LLFSTLFVSGEALPLFIMFSSDAQQEESYRIRADWAVSLPKVIALFGHRQEQTFPARLIVNEKGGTDSRVLNEVLKQYVETLYPDAKDEDGYRVCFKLDGGPGRLNIPMLADLRCKGVYLFPGVQNTTHVTQETDQSYGLFKSQLRQNIQTLMSFNNATYHHQRQLHDAFPDLHALPPALPSLNRSHYGMLLSGNSSEPVLLPAFANAFTRERCLRSWRLCGAVPLTRSALANPSVQREVTLEDNNNTPDVIFVASNAAEFDWTTATLLELEEQNKAACDKLSKLGLNGEALRLKAPRAPARLGSKISSDASEAERIKALSAVGFNLGSIFTQSAPLQ
jgi:hypothetical protein